MAEQTSTTATKSKKPLALKIIFWIIALVAVNIIAYQLWIQWDLTHDKRYTIHEQTKHMLRNIEEPVHVKIFLTGDELPAGFARLSRSATQLVRTFKDISRNKVNFEIIDPNEVDTVQLREMQEYGLIGFPVTVAQAKGGTKQVPITPYALVSNGQRKIPVTLQINNSPRLTQTDINNSEILLEYNIANAIRKVSKPALDTVLYLLGNGEPESYEVYDMANTLNKEFVFLVNDLDSMPTIPNTYKVAIINKPQESFSELDKYKLDQYLMHGGNLLFALDGVQLSMDSLREKPGVGIAIETNLNDLLFNYGVRINMNIVSDADRCIDIPLQSTSNPNAQAQMYPWVYYPIFEPGSEHPIVKNLNEILGKFSSSLDLVNDIETVQKTVLLQTSKYAKTESAPLSIDLKNAIYPLDRSKFNKSYLVTGVLAEGAFQSLYQARLPQELQGVVSDVKKVAAPSAKVVVFSDGDIFTNEVSQQSGPMEMGMYPFSPYKFNNKSMLLNTIEYLTDTFNLLDARSKSFEASLLDRNRIQAERTTWQWINIGIPAVLVIIFGLFFNYFRKRKYTS